MRGICAGDDGIWFWVGFDVVDAAGDWSEAGSGDLDGVFAFGDSDDFCAILSGV